MVSIPKTPVSHAPAVEGRSRFADHLARLRAQVTDVEFLPLITQMVAIEQRLDQCDIHNLVSDLLPCMDSLRRLRHYGKKTDDLEATVAALETSVANEFVTAAKRCLCEGKVVGGAPIPIASERAKRARKNKETMKASEEALARDLAAARAP